jgi:hypothetical protein
MNADKWEPTLEQLDGLARDIERLTGVSYNLGQTMTVAILTRQHEREAGLLALLATRRDTLGREDVLLNKREVARVLAAHAALDAPPVPTLLEAARAVFNAPLQDGPAVIVPKALTDALKAAVERADASLSHPKGCSERAK